ncbi:MAG: LuxR C-terminal-related transcriptional regulator [Caldilineaceae bacterium]
MKTKLNPRSLRSSHIHRPRLIKSLDHNLDRKLTLLCAPAGFGKSALLSEWISLNNLHFAWLSLDQNDNDPLTFLEYLFAACQVAWDRVAYTESVSQPGTMPAALQAAIVTLTNTIAAHEHQIILILDNYHVISNTLIHRMIVQLLDNLSAQLHLVIAARTVPPLSLARLRARGQMSELRTDDLRFTQVETTEFFQHGSRCELTDAQIVELHTRAEGWVEGLHIATLLLHELNAEQRARFVGEFSGGNRYVADYLFEEVFAPQSGELQTFLLQTSLLDRLNGLLCSFVTGQGHGQEHLEFLEEGNLFIVPLDEQRNWYRYHLLFGEFLRHRLHQSYPDQIPLLHSRASQWYEQNGLLPEAIQHALAGQEWDRAMYLIDQIADSTLMRDRFAVINGKEPRLSTATNELYAADPPEAVDSLTNPRLLRSDVFTEQTHANALALGRAHLRLGQVHKAEQFLSAVNLAAPQFQGATAQLALVSTLSECRLIQGRLHLALATCEPLLALASAQTRQPYLFNFYCNLHHIHYEWNQLQVARQYLERCLAEMERNESAPSWALEAYLAQVWLNWAEGKDAAAGAAMHKAEQVAPTLADAESVRKVKAHRARFDLRRGAAQSAARWAQEAGLKLQNAGDYGAQFEYLTLARVMLAQKEAASALHLLDQLQSSAVEAGRGKDVIEIMVLRALGHKLGNEPNAAFAALAQAVCEAEQEGYVRAFIDEGPLLHALLQQVAASGITRLYVQKLLDSFPQTSTATKSTIKPATPTEPAVSLVEPLSPRELEVLRLVAAGQANREIAQTLHVATSTVKKHVGNILAKLGVRNRTRAAAKARELRLI